MAEFVNVFIQDFEGQFGMLDKRDPGRRAFELIRPEGQEAYYRCNLIEKRYGTVFVKVLTSVRSDRNKARGNGEDAIRVFLIWGNVAGWSVCLGRTARVNRVGTAYRVVERALDRARKVAAQHRDIVWCEYCGNPLVERINKNNGRKYWGCSAYPHTGCRSTNGIFLIPSKKIDWRRTKVVDNGSVPI